MVWFLSPQRLAVFLMIVCNNSIAIRGVYSLVVQSRLERCSRCWGKYPPHRRSFSTTGPRSTIRDTDSIFAIPSVCHTWFDLSLPEGRCVGIQLEDLPDSSPDAITKEQIANPDHWIHSFLNPKEVAYGLTLDAQTPSFLSGRLAMHVALGSQGEDFAIMKDENGRPCLPPGMLGSISHKSGRGVALVAPCPPPETNAIDMRVGVDLETTLRRSRVNIATRVLTDKEQQELGRIPDITAEEEVLLRFR
jgi:hypothetical protein